MQSLITGQKTSVIKLLPIRAGGKKFSWQKFLHNIIIIVLYSLHNNLFLSHGLLILRQCHSKLSKFGHHFLWIISNIFLDEGIHL